MKQASKRTLRHGLAGAVLLAVSATVAASAGKFVDDAREYLGKGEHKAAVIQLKNALQRDPTYLEARLLLGETYLVLGDGAAAAKEFDRASQLGASAEQWMPGYARALLLTGDTAAILERVQPGDDMPAAQRASVLALRGHALLASNDREGAGEAYEAALAANPGEPQARLGKAQLLVLDGDRDGARGELDRLLGDQPDFGAALVLRGELARQAGDLDAAAGDFARAVEAEPNNLRAHIGVGLVAIAQRRADDTLAAVQDIRSRFGNVTLAAYLHALAAFQKGQLDTAAEQLQTVLKVMPSHVQSQLLFGVISYGRGEYLVADEYLSRVAASLGAQPAVAKLLGAVRLRLREPQRAIEAMQAASDRFPDDVQLLALLGNAYLQAGDNTRGSEYLARAVERDPEQALLRTQLAIGRLAGGNTDSAIAELETAIELGQDVLQADVLLVLSYLKRGEQAKALEAAESLKARMPDSPIPVNLLGLAHLAGGDFAEADAQFAEALALDPGFVVAIINRARTALASGNPEGAAAHYRAALQVQPGHLGALLGLAALAEKQNDRQAMAGYLEQAHEANPDALQPRLALAEYFLREGEALKALAQLSDLTPEQAAQPAALRVTGMAQLQAGEFASAVRTLEQLTASRPDYIEGWFQLARAQTAADRIDAARESFRKAVALDSGHQVPIVWVGLGELELRAKDFDAALEQAARIRERFPANAMAYDIEAAAHRGLGRADAAIAALEQAVRMEPTRKRVNVLAQSLAAAGRPAEAAAALEHWLAGHPDDGPTWAALGLLLHQSGREQEAVSAYEASLKATPGNPVVQNNLAWLYQSHGDARGLEIARKAFEAAPNRPEIADTYGWILFQQGRHQQGLNILQQALVAAPRNPEIALHVAEALHVLQRSDEARPLLERVRREHPGSTWEAQAADLLARLP